MADSSGAQDGRLPRYARRSFGPSPLHPAWPGWAVRLGLAARFALVDRRSTPVALLGFLVRGGLVLLLLPMAVVPSVLQIAGLAGPRAITIAGDITPWVVALAAGALTLILVWLLVAGIVGSLTDSWLAAMALRPARAGTPVRLPLPSRWQLGRLTGIRMACLVPVAVALAWATGRLYDVTYAEWISPSDLAAPLVLRVALGAADAVALVVVAWLASETLAAVAVRRQLLLGRGARRSIIEAADQIARRPVSTVMTMVVTHAASAAALLGAMAVTATAFDWCRSAARAAEPIAIRLGVGELATTRDFRPLAFAAASVALALAWAAALAVSGVTSAWRNAALTNEVADAVRTGGQGLQQAAPGR